MIYLYWPTKQVPGWLNTISFSGVSDGSPAFHHGGFGVAWVFKKRVIVQPIAGYFMKIMGAGMACEVKAGTHEVIIRPRIF